MLPATQSAYRQFHSTESAVLKVYRLYSDMLLASDSGQISALCLLDLTAAFDTVDHDLLMLRLDERQFGFCGVVLQWFRSYLSDRSFRVVLSTYFVFSSSVLFCIPQGSVLGPRMFILYIADHGGSCWRGSELSGELPFVCWWLADLLALSAIVEYFASVGVTDNGCLPRIHHNADVNCSLNNIMFTADNVKAAINKLKPNLSSGPDGLPPLYCSSGYAVFLPNLFLSFSTNYFLSLMSPLNGSKLLLSLTQERLIYKYS